MIPLNKKKTELVTIRVEAEMKKNIEQIATDNVATEFRFLAPFMIY